MRRGIGLAWLAITAVIAGIASYFSYQAGWSAAIATKLPAGAAVAPYWYGAHWGAGFFPFFPIFGFFWFLLFLLLIFWIARRAAGFGRWGGGWRHEGRVPPPLEDRLREWHRQAHEQPSEKQ